MEGVLLRPLPYASPERLLTLHENQPQVPNASLSVPDFKDLRAPVAANCRAVVLMGRDSELIAKAIGDEVPLIRVNSLIEAVERCKAVAEPGDAVLLSPACASFDMFKNYEERGHLFAQAVEGLK